ncbi:MAG: hypothetical protein QNJ22_22865, partial [Desulfosarcinaceae bacterium]|nr:hypothetical protein [Desulfosarcinaceae bacterium]
MIPSSSFSPDCDWATCQLQAAHGGVSSLSRLPPLRGLLIRVHIDNMLIYHDVRNTTSLDEG